MKSIVLLLTFFTVISENSFARGGWVDVGNGGDGIFCYEDPTTSPFIGYYSLDYIATYDPLLLLSEPTEVLSWQESLKNIEHLIKPISKEWASHLNEFSKYVFNKTNVNANFLWQSKAFGMIDIEDEHIELFQLPKNCLVDGEPKKIQAVIRQPPILSGLPVWKTLYHFVPEVTKELEQNNPVQLSYLLFHEFLWSYSDNISQNRNINRLLHSKRAQNLTPEVLKQELIGLGFSLSGNSLENFKGCEAESISSTELYKLQNKIQNNTLEIDVSAQFLTKECSLEKGCSPFYQDQTTTDLQTSNASIVNILSLISHNPARHDILLAIKPMNILDTTLIKCELVQKKENLANCQYLGNQGAAWWNLNNSGEALPNFTLNGKLTENGICLEGNQYINQNEDWRKYKFKINGFFNEN